MKCGNKTKFIFLKFLPPQIKNIFYIYLIKYLKHIIMAKSQDAKKNVKKEPLKSAKEKKEAKRDKKAKRD